ncbi:unnamed protein product [Mytilus edulis]|uniref:Uncharacterized protein n=1 Tax=Mytilus edulis TaxID=6550 RepID=A0A8S3USM3_MYTED|nr:unnamed protein product [Mytilus edulis]
MEKLCPVAFGVIALLFLVAGAFSPGWMVMDSSRVPDMSDHDTSDAVTLHMGFFYLLIIGKDFSMSLGYGSIPDDGGISYMERLGWNLLEYQIEIIIGVVLCILSLILTLVYNRDRAPSMLLVPIITSAIAGRTHNDVRTGTNDLRKGFFSDVAIAAYF